MIVCRVEIGLKNVGDKAAGQTTFNVLLPTSVYNFRVYDLSGDPRPGGLASTSETLQLPDGGETTTQFATFDIPHVKNRTSIVFFVEFGSNPADSADLPIRIKVQPDDLPDDIEE